MIKLSFLLPTRGRPYLVQRFFQSIMETTHNLSELEIILAVDEDDLPSQQITHETLNIKKTVLPPGTSMGLLNQSCFEASSGRYVMLINDDVILRTKNWDLKVGAAFARFKDDIALIHINDLLFQEKLCTFPFMTRRACLEIGVCPVEYKRYRIDDHIYDTYRHLAYLGHRRIVYLPEVIFEHDNYETQVRDLSGQFFKSSDNKVYIPDPETIKPDARFFDETLEQRKQNALKLAQLIEQSENLAQITSSEKAPNHHNTATVTVGVVTSGLQKEHARKCLSALKKHTSNYDLFVLDNSDSTHFNHPREMNKILETAKTDYVVLMDDDVYVEKGWLEGLLGAMDQETGVVTPMHQNGNGAVSFSGAYLLGDEFGTHRHHLDTPEQPRAVQCLCSAILLIDIKKCGHIRFNTNYQKYFLDIAYSLEVWESGFKTVCTPEVLVTHIGGATLQQGSLKALSIWNRDISVFAKEWIDSGRLTEIQREIWTRFPFLKQLVEIPERINRFFEDELNQSEEKTRNDLDELIQLCRPHDLFLSHLVSHLKTATQTHHARRNLKKEKLFEEKVLELKDAPNIPTGYIPVLPESFASITMYIYLNCLKGLLDRNLMNNKAYKTKIRPLLKKIYHWGLRKSGNWYG